MNSRFSHSEPGTRKRLCAFTLFELVIVTALVILLSLVFIPSLASVRPPSAASYCLNNLRQLGAAWRMYADDNGGRLVYNRDGGNVGQAYLSEAWVAGWLDFSSNTQNTNTAMLTDHNRYPYGAYFGPYIKSPVPFKCPADPSTAPIALRRLPRARSVSMNNSMGEGSRSWSMASPYQLYRRIDSIGKPTPAGLWILLDEREESINDGCFFTNPDSAYNLIDYPAAYHNRGAGFAFADGHSEIRRWVDPRTTPVVQPGQILQLNVTLPGDVDVVWLQQHATSKP